MARIVTSNSHIFSTSSISLSATGSTNILINGISTLFVTNSRVGISNLTSPNYTLDVNGEINALTSYRVAGNIFANSSGGLTASLLKVNNLASNGIVFYNGASLINNSKLSWDNTEFRLGVGTSSINAILHINAGNSGDSNFLLEKSAGQIAYSITPWTDRIYFGAGTYYKDSNWITQNNGDSRYQLFGFYPGIGATWFAFGVGSNPATDTKTLWDDSGSWVSGIDSTSITSSLYGTSSWALDAITSSLSIFSETSVWSIDSQFSLTSSNSHTSSWATNVVPGAKITASLMGTSSWANNAISASWASASISSSYALFTSTASGSISSSYAFYAATTTGSGIIGTLAFAYACNTASLARTASYITASNISGRVPTALTASNADTASYAFQAANSFTAVSASYAPVTGEITNAQTASMALSINFVPSASLSASWASSSLDAKNAETAQTAQMATSVNMPYGNTIYLDDGVGDSIALRSIGEKIVLTSPNWSWNDLMEQGLSINNDGVHASKFIGTASCAVTSSYLNPNTQLLKVGKVDLVNNQLFFDGASTIECHAGQYFRLQTEEMSDPLLVGIVGANVGFHGNLFGTASHADNAVTAAYLLSSGQHLSIGSLQVGDISLNGSSTITDVVGDYITLAPETATAVHIGLKDGFDGIHGTASWATNAVNANNAATAAYLLSSNQHLTIGSLQVGEISLNGSSTITDVVGDYITLAPETATAVHIGLKDGFDGVHGTASWAASASAIEGTLPIASGGTNATTFAANSIPYFDGTRLVGTSSFTNVNSTIKMQSNTPGFWLDELNPPPTLTSSFYFLVDGGQFQIQTRGLNFGSYTATPFNIDCRAAANTLYMTYNSRVGIGTSAPGAKLHVMGNISASAVTASGIQALSTLDNEKYMWNTQEQFSRVLIPFDMVASSGGATNNYEGIYTCNMRPASGSANAYNYCHLARTITGAPGYSGAGINFGRTIRLYESFVHNVIDTNGILRFVVGNGSVARADAPALNTYGFGVELRGAEKKAYLFAHNGTTYSTSSTGIAYVANPYTRYYGLVLESNGAGTINLYWGEALNAIPRVSTTPTLTMTGGPTNVGPGASSYVTAYLTTTSGNGVIPDLCKAIIMNSKLQVVQ